MVLVMRMFMKKMREFSCDCKISESDMTCEHTPGTVGSLYFFWLLVSNWEFATLLEGTSVLDIEGRRERCTFTHPAYNSCR